MEMVQKILYQIEKSTVTILNLELKPLPKSYTCKVFRIHVNYLTELHKQSCTTTFIAKVKDDKMTFATDLGMLKKEMIMYKEGLPKLETIIRDKVSPKTYLLTEDIIIIEDLSLKGYTNITNPNLLDYNHCISGVEVLAKFHAASVALFQSDPKLVKDLGEELFYKEELYEKFHGVIENSLQSLLDQVEMWPESRHYKQPILKIKNKIWELLIREITKNNFMPVLNHGDFTLNNILFKYNLNGDICDVNIIDFQCCRYSSPVIDLQYFLSTSIESSVIENRLYDILDFYVNTFNSFLSNFNCPQKLLKSEFELEFKKGDFISLYASSMSLPQYLVDDKQQESLNGVDFEVFKNAETNPVLKLMRLPKYREVMSNVLRILEKRGLFVE